MATMFRNLGRLTSGENESLFRLQISHLSSIIKLLTIFFLLFVTSLFRLPTNSNISDTKSLVLSSTCIQGV